MGWFSTLVQLLFPSVQRKNQEEKTKALADIVSLDQDLLNHPNPTHKSTLSPFASRILEKAQEQRLRSTEDDTEEEPEQKLSSPADLFLENGQAKQRVQRIQNIVLERNKQAENKFTAAARKMPDTIFKPSKKISHQ